MALAYPDNKNNWERITISAKLNRHQLDMTYDMALALTVSAGHNMALAYPDNKNNWKRITVSAKLNRHQMDITISPYHRISCPRFLLVVHLRLSFPSQSSSFPPDLVMAPISLLLPLRSVRLSLPTVYIGHMPHLSCTGVGWRSAWVSRHIGVVLVRRCFPHMSVRCVACALLVRRCPQRLCKITYASG